MPRRAEDAICNVLINHPDAVVRYVDAIAVESRYLVIEPDRTVLFLNPEQQRCVEELRRD